MSFQIIHPSTCAQLMLKFKFILTTVSFKIYSPKPSRFIKSRGEDLPADQKKICRERSRRSCICMDVLGGCRLNSFPRSALVVASRFRVLLPIPATAAISSDDDMTFP